MSKAERTKQFIIETAAPIINKKGMAGTSMSDIMEATKLAKGGIYGNFESKDEICKEAYSYLSSQLAGRLNEAVKAGKTAKEKLDNLLDVYKNRSLDGGCPILNFGIEADDTHPEIKARVNKSISSARNRIAEIAVFGIEHREISKDLNVHIFSTKVFAMIEGAIMCRRIMDSDEVMQTVIETIKKDFESHSI
ncbi:transcriptional regulator, TetR family [Chryseobacterium arachidis]|uniref:Transcriptional regulator, TetR family n=1 Tax=Chryseobacterium arachidis TaxID=1416778 RepID=A0A1M5GKR8_9FLAO|nr:TetR/AcrR family transcriptional regulator [Chryseobacterium arachidis]SHG04293.1 transcriptional regulator, TetR family [Chryseobacterium arachidis]